MARAIEKKEREKEARKTRPKVVIMGCGGGGGAYMQALAHALTHAPEFNGGISSSFSQDRYRK